MIPALGVLLLVARTVVNPRRLARQTRFFRVASLRLVGWIGVAKPVALGMLHDALLASQVSDGRTLLTVALQVWLTNIIAFGPAFWEFDGGWAGLPRPGTPRRAAAG